MVPRVWASAASCAILFGIGCGPTYLYHSSNYAKEYDPRQHEYVIGVADSLHINVRDQNDLSGSAVVRPDGVITLPLLGDVSVAGQTPSAVREELKKRFSAYVKDALVTVAVTAVNSYRFVVSG